MSDPSTPSPDQQQQPVAAVINTFSPRSEGRILTRGYRPQGSDKIPVVVPPLVSGVYFPHAAPQPVPLNEPQAPYTTLIKPVPQGK